MNANAKVIGMEDTWYDSPHGLSNEFNQSTASDQARLASHCLKKYTEFEEIVSTATMKYTVEVPLEFMETPSTMINEDGTHFIKEPSNTHTYEWENTNKMLGKKNWIGVKTGITRTAGPCLIAAARKEDVCLIMVLLHSRSMDIRWEEVSKIWRWVYSRMKKYK
jgi:D-alanyl-D-alanine carboxypeptidase